MSGIPNILRGWGVPLVTSYHISCLQSPSSCLPPPASGVKTRVSQFRFKKNFALRRDLAKQKQFRFVSLQFRETRRNSFASFRFNSLRKFRFVSLKIVLLRKFRFKKKFRFGSFAIKKVSLRKFRFKNSFATKVSL